jgi:hypothetical protein
LRNKGAEVVEGNLDNPLSLTAAFAAANVIFAVTKMIDGATEREVTQGKNIANAAAGIPTLEKFIWSTLPSASTISQGRIPVPHMDGKAQVDEYILKSQPALARKAMFLWGGFYAENVQYPNFVFHALGDSGKYVWIQPVRDGTVVPMVGDHNSNIGTIVERMLERPDICPPMTYVLAVTDWMEHGELLRMWAQLVGEKNGMKIEPIYVHSDLEVVDRLWPSLGKEMGLMLKVLDLLGKEAWSKKDAKIVTLQDLELEVGTDLVSTEMAVRKLAAATEVPVKSRETKGSAQL